MRDDRPVRRARGQPLAALVVGPAACTELLGNRALLALTELLATTLAAALLAASTSER